MDTSRRETARGAGANESAMSNRVSECFARPLVRLLVVALPALFSGACMNHYLIHERQAPPAVSTRSEVVERDGLRMRVEWALPDGTGTAPAVLVHPEAGHPARQMRGILHSLAERGYVAMAVDYKRTDGRGKLFAWQEKDDVRAALDLLAAHPRVERQRIGAMGYSQGGIFSLLIAAETDGLAAVVAYYPITDFDHWLNRTERKGPRRLVFDLIRRHFRKRSGAQTDEEFARFLDRASPLPKADRILAPVLLIHGDADPSAGVEESRRLAAALEARGRKVRLVEVPDAGHVFNFQNRERARVAWQEATAWLDTYLAPPGA